MSRVHPLHPSQDRTHQHNNHASTHTSQPQRDIKRPQPNNHPSNHHRDIKRVPSNGHNALPRQETKRAPPTQYSGSRQTIAPRGTGAPLQSHQQQRRAQISAFEIRERQRRAAFEDKDYPSNVKAVILSCMVTWLFCVVLGIISFCYASEYKHLIFIQ